MKRSVSNYAPTTQRNGRLFKIRLTLAASLSSTVMHPVCTVPYPFFTICKHMSVLHPRNICIDQC